MMTFNLNRPVYSYGLGLGFALVLTGQLSCIIPVEDSRDFLVAHQNELQVTDMRMQTINDGRVMSVNQIREFKVFQDRVELVTSDRVFIVESDRYFVVKRDCHEKY